MHVLVVTNNAAENGFRFVLDIVRRIYCFTCQQSRRTGSRALSNREGGYRYLRSLTLLSMDGVEIHRARTRNCRKRLPFILLYLYSRGPHPKSHRSAIRRTAWSLAGKAPSVKCYGTSKTLPHRSSCRAALSRGCKLRSLLQNRRRRLILWRTHPYPKKIGLASVFFW